MTLEQIVNTHPCPIIRGKIMENVTEPNYVVIDGNDKLQTIVFHCIGSWYASKEGSKFWKSVYMDNTLIYDQIKHLDNSYVPEPAKPLPVWRKIDPKHLPDEKVVVKNNKNETHYGNLWKYGNILRIDNDNIKDPTHYIPLSDLINLPIED